MLAEVAQIGVTDELSCRLREQSLPAVARGGDARGAVDVDTDVSLFRPGRLASVDADPNPDQAVSGERRLCLDRGRECGRRLGERDEKRVSLCVDLDPAMTGDDRPQQTAMLRERLHVVVAELLEQPRRARDIG